MLFQESEKKTESHICLVQLSRVVRESQRQRSSNTERKKKKNGMGKIGLDVKLLAHVQ